MEVLQLCRCGATVDYSKIFCESCGNPILHNRQGFKSTENYWSDDYKRSIMTEKGYLRKLPHIVRKDPFAAESKSSPSTSRTATSIKPVIRRRRTGKNEKLRLLPLVRKLTNAEKLALSFAGGKMISDGVYACHGWRDYVPSDVTKIEEATRLLSNSASVNSQVSTKQEENSIRHCNMVRSQGIAYPLKSDESIEGIVKDDVVQSLLSNHSCSVSNGFCKCCIFFTRCKIDAKAEVKIKQPGDELKQKSVLITFSWSIGSSLLSASVEISFNLSRILLGRTFVLTGDESHDCNNAVQTNKRLIDKLLSLIVIGPIKSENTAGIVEWENSWNLTDDTSRNSNRMQSVSSTMIKLKIDQLRFGLQPLKQLVDPKCDVELNSNSETENKQQQQPEAPPASCIDVNSLIDTDIALPSKTSLCIFRLGVVTIDGHFCIVQLKPIHKSSYVVLSISCISCINESSSVCSIVCGNSLSGMSARLLIAMEAKRSRRKDMMQNLINALSNFHSLSAPDVKPSDEFKISFEQVSYSVNCKIISPPASRFQFIDCSMKLAATWGQDQGKVMLRGICVAVCHDDCCWKLNLSLQCFLQAMANSKRILIASKSTHSCTILELLNDLTQTNESKAMVLIECTSDQDTATDIANCLSNAMEFRQDKLYVLGNHISHSLT